MGSGHAQPVATSHVFFMPAELDRFGELVAQAAARGTSTGCRSIRSYRSGPMRAAA
jgi:hypothetical protein